MHTKNANKLPPNKRGQGRKKGGVSEKTKMLREISAKALADGVTPLEVMLDNMRFYHSEGDVVLEKILEGIKKVPSQKLSEELVEFLKALGNFRVLAGKFAADAAPYCHAKLNNITLDGNVTHKVEEADAAYKTIEGTLGEIVASATVGVGFQGEVDSGSQSKSIDPRELEPKDTGRKLVHLVDARRTRVG